MNNKDYKPTEHASQHANEPVAEYGIQTVFTPAQVELLTAMAELKTDKEVHQLKWAISEFFANRADEEMERLWADGTWNEQTLEELKHAHFRTPYKH